MGAEKPKTILLVEDEAIIALTEKMTLEKYGYRVITARTGEEAVATVEKTPAIDLILMDINLGTGIDGTEAAAIILRQRDIPVVFLSSHTEPEVVAKTEKITSYGYVVKDSSGTVLDASIKMAFKLFEAKIKEKEKEAALQESEASYRMLFSGASDGILLADSQTRQFRYANPAICRMLGYTEEELLRKNVADIHPKESLNHVLAEFAALARGEIRSSPDLPCLRKDGTIFYADISHSTVVLEGREYHAGFFHDITERKQTEEAIFQSKKDWEDSFDSITDMITVHDNDYNIIRTNKAGKTLLKLPALEAHLKLKCFSFYHGTDAPPAGCPSCDCLKSGRPGVFELFEPYLNCYLEIRAIPRFDSNNQRVGLIHIVRDITERKQMESKSEAALEALHKNEERMRAIVEGTPHLFFYTQDADANTTYVSPTVEHITGHKPEIWLKRKDWFITDAAINRTAREKTHAHLRGEFFEEPVLLEIRHASGHPILLEAYEYPVTRNGKIVGLQGVTHDISERMHTEEKLRESEERLRDILFSMVDWVWEVDGNGVYTYSSDKGQEFFGASRGDIIGKTPFDFMPADEAKRVGAIFSEIIANKLPIKELENWNIGRNGEMICLLTNGVPILDKKGNLKGYRGVDKDISERKRAEKLTETLYKISQAVYDTDNLNELFTHVHRALANIIPTANLFIALLSDDGRALTFPYFIDEKDSGDNRPIATDDRQSLTVEVLTAKKSLLLDEAELLDRYASGRNRVWGTAPRCWLGVPLMIREKIIGVMVVQDYDTAGAYGRKDVALLESTAGQIAVAIDRKRAESQREAALKALRESEERFHSLFDNMNEGVALHDLVFENGKPANYRIINVNDRFLKILGLSGQHVIGKLASEAYGTATAPYLDEYVGVAVSKKAVSFETYFASLDKHFAISAAPWRESGFATIFTDITERKQAEETLRTSEAQQSNALQMTKAGHWEYDVVHDVFTFNDNFYRIFRTTAAAVGGYQMSSEHYARKFCHPDDMAMVGDETRKAIEATDPNYSRQIEHRILYADGQVGYIIVRFFIIKDPQGRTVKTYGVNQDISERKWAEMEITRQLAEKEILLREVHHRIKNNIAAVSGLLSLHLKSVSNPEAVAVLQDAIGRVDSMGILYDKLLLSEGYHDIPVKGYVESLASAVVSLFPDRARIKLDLHIADFHLGSKKLFPLGIIINELLTNKMKYAFSGRKRGAIRIDLALADNRAKLTIEDDGNTLPPGFDVKEAKGFGLMLVKMLSQQLGGNFTMEKDAGTRCKLEFNI
jgi:PAS domain S-box-containing protein